MIPKEPIDDNRIFTGNDKPLNVEQAGNIIHSPEFHKLQRSKIDNILKISRKVDSEEDKKHQLNVAISRIPNKNGGELMRKVLSCRVAGYSYNQMAKALRKFIDPTASLGKIIKAIKAVEKEAIYRVNVALSQSRIIVPDALN